MFNHILGSAFLLACLPCRFFSRPTAAFIILIVLSDVYDVCDVSHPGLFYLWPPESVANGEGLTFTVVFEEIFIDSNPQLINADGMPCLSETNGLRLTNNPGLSSWTQVFM